VQDHFLNGPLGSKICIRFMLLSASFFSHRILLIFVKPLRDEDFDCKSGAHCQDDQKDHFESALDRVRVHNGSH